jgi:hypothetical protein
MRYYETIANKRVMIMALHGPPWNGFTMHVERVRQALVKQRNTISFVDLQFKQDLRLQLLFQLLLFARLCWSRPQIILCYTTGMEGDLTEFAVLARWKLLFSPRLVWIVHHKPLFTSLTLVERERLEYYALVIDQLVDIGFSDAGAVVKALLPSTRHSKDAEFITPELLTAAAIVREYSLPVRTFIKIRNPVIMIGTTGTNGIFEVSAKDFTHLLHVLDELTKIYEYVGILWGVGSKPQVTHKSSIYQQFAHAGLQEHLFIFENRQPLWPLLRHVHLLWWPHTYNGSLLKEALACKTPIVASSACKRPEGVTVYQQGDIHDCVQKLLLYMPHRSRRKKQQHIEVR